MIPDLLESRFLGSVLHERILIEGIISLVGVVYFRLIGKLRIEVEGVQPNVLVGSEIGMRIEGRRVKDCSFMYLLGREIVHIDN